MPRPSSKTKLAKTPPTTPTGDVPAPITPTRPAGYVRSPSELFAELAVVPDAATYLRENGKNFGVMTVLQLAFDPKISLELPEGEPPYRADPNPPDRTLKRFDSAVRDLGRCARGVRLGPGVKEKIFIGILESCSQKDAEIIIAAKDKKLTELYPIVTRNLVIAAFPDWNAVKG